jgi:hypothetical protein
MNNRAERVMVVVNNYHGYWEYGVSAFLPWNTAQAVAQRTANAMLAYGDMGLGTWQAHHTGKMRWNIPYDSSAGHHLVGDYYPMLWTGNLLNIGELGNNRALNFRDRMKYVFVTTDGTNPTQVQYWHASDDIIREEFGRK